MLDTENENTSRFEISFMIFLEMPGKHQKAIAGKTKFPNFPQIQRLYDIPEKVLENLAYSLAKKAQEAQYPFAVKATYVSFVDCNTNDACIIEDIPLSGVSESRWIS